MVYSQQCNPISFLTRRTSPGRRRLNLKCCPGWLRLWTFVCDNELNNIRRSPHRAMYIEIKVQVQAEARHLNGTRPRLRLSLSRLGPRGAGWL